MHTKVDPVHATDENDRGVYLILKIVTSWSAWGLFTDSKAASQFTFSGSWLRGGKEKGQEGK